MPRKRPLGTVVVTLSLSLASAISVAQAAAASPSRDISSLTQQRCVSEASAAVVAARKPLLPVAPSPIDMKKNAGKSVWLISASQDEFTEVVGAGFLAAAKAAGMTGRYVEANGSPSTMIQLVQEAVVDRASGIALLNIEPAAVSGPLAAARTHHITVVTVNDGDPGQHFADTYANVTDAFSQQGQVTGAWMLMTSSCHVHVATFDITTVPVTVDMINGAISEINRLCPVGACSVSQYHFEYSTFATALGPLVESVLRRDPSINYVDPAADAFAGVINPVLQQAGFTKVKLTGHDGSSSNLKQMAAHRTLQAMTIANPPENYTGWVILNTVARGMLGEPPVNVALGGRLIDATNIGNGSFAAIYPGFSNFQQLFLKAWGM